MRDGFTFMELLVAVFLIVTVIAALLSITAQNLNFVSQKDNNLRLSAATAVLLAAHQIKDDKTLYFNDIMNFKNDNVNQKFKDMKFDLRTTQLQEQTLYEDTPYPLKVYATKHEVFDELLSRSFTTIKISQ